MPLEPQMPPAYRGNRHRNAQELKAWHAQCMAEPALEPHLPMVDPHHHLYGSPSDTYHYTRQDLSDDLGSGHRIMGTVYLEAYDSGWHVQGPPALRSTGEVDMIVRQAQQGPLALPHGPCDLAQGIVSSVDLLLGDAVEEVIQAHLLASQGRLRGVRHHLTHDTGLAGQFVYNKPPHLAADPQFRRGFSCLQGSGLSFDAFIFHTQLQDLADLAERFPQTPIVLNHVGTMIRVAQYAAHREEVQAQWERGMRALARQANVFVKIGGLGMPIFGFGFEHAQHPSPSGPLAVAWQPIIDFCIGLFGSERCMFESNFPVDKQSCSYAALWNAFKLATRHRSPRERRHLFYQTACHVYRLPELAHRCDLAWSEQT